jgi:hypothetical protein
MNNVYYCMVCEKVIRPKRIEIDVRRGEVRVDHEHEYIVFIENGAAVPLNRKTAQLLRTLNRIRYIESSV